MKFKDFYQFTFAFAKSPGQKGLGECEVHSREKPHPCETERGSDQPGVRAAPTGLRRSGLLPTAGTTRGRAALHHRHAAVTVHFWVSVFKCQNAN